MRLSRILLLSINIFIFFCASLLFGCANSNAYVYTITLDYGEGSGNITTLTIQANADIPELPNPLYCPEEQVFIGWVTENGDIVTQNTKFTFESNIILYANYKLKEYKIEYNLNSGDSLPTDALKVYSMSEQEQDLPIPIKRGNDFKGWKIDTTEDIITAIPARKTGDLSLVAMWQAKTYTITFDYGDGFGSEENRQVIYGETVTSLPTVTPAAGKDFNGWHVSTADGALFEEAVVYNYDEDITLVAAYIDHIETSFKITYHLNDGEALQSDAIKIYTVSEFEQPLPTATKVGCNFDGWKIDGTEEVITSIPANKTGDLNFSAVWSDKTYKITFDSGVDTVINIKYGETINDLPNATPASDKTFDGWQTEDGLRIIIGTAYNFDKDIELKAIFSAKKFTVTIRNATRASFTKWADGTKGDKVVEIEVGGKITIPAIKYDNMSSEEKKESEYSFSGWFYKDKNGSVRQLDLNTEFTLENLNLDEYELVVFAKVSTPWTGDF